MSEESNIEMSFGQKLKTELCERHLPTISSKQALLHGLILYSRSFDREKIVFHTEYECVAMLFIQLAEELTGGKAAVEVFGDVAKLFSVSLVDESKEICKYFRFLDRDFSYYMNNSADAGVFMRGVFMACGYISDPNKTYRLEFVVGDKQLCDRLVYISEASGIALKHTVRKATDVLYVKDSAMIEDTVTFIGGMTCSMELMNVKIFKDLRNNINRQTNCDTANIEKTITAAQQQIEDIEYIKNTVGLSFLSPELEQLAEVRLENPESSLSELCQMLTPPLSRSGVSHRIRRISQLANELRANKKGEV